MQKSTWGAPTTNAGANTPRKKIPYTTKYRIKDDVSSDQRKTMERWNEMVDYIRDVGGMEEK